MATRKRWTKEVKKHQVSLKSKACKHHKVNNNGRALAHVYPKY